MKHLQPWLGLEELGPGALPWSSLTQPDPTRSWAWHQHLLLPACLDAMLASHGPCASLGPFLSGTCSLSHMAQPSPAEVPRSMGCCSLLLLPAAAVPRGGAGGAALRPGQHCLAPALVWYAAQTSYTSTAVLPAPTPSWPGHWKASRQSRVGMGPGELLQLLLGCWPSRKAMRHLDSHGLGPVIADTC